MNAFRLPRVLLWSLVALIALLQAMLPLLHVHIGPDSGPSGLHVDGMQRLVSQHAPEPGLMQRAVANSLGQDLSSQSSLRQSLPEEPPAISAGSELRRDGGRDPQGDWVALPNAASPAPDFSAPAVGQIHSAVMARCHAAHQRPPSRAPPVILPA